jgi:glycosyltransferase involved in cell wall biosynthesis
MSLGIPCIASRYGGNPEMVREGENGLLFPARQEAALAAAIERLRTDRALYVQLSRGAGARFVRELRAQEMAAKYDALYAELCEKKNGPS